MNILTLLAIGGGAFLLLSGRKASATTRSAGWDVGLTPNVCANNARRRDMTSMHGRLSELVPVESYGSQERLHPEAAQAYNALLAAARAAGFQPPLFQVVSGYRTFESQKKLFAAQLQKQRAMHPDWSDSRIEDAARSWVAAPGSSDHETGCAVDFWLGHGISARNNEAIRSSAAYKWLSANAWRFGFCEYAATGKAHPGEGWHWKYILRSARRGPAVPEGKYEGVRVPGYRGVGCTVVGLGRDSVGC